MCDGNEVTARAHALCDRETVDLRCERDDEVEEEENEELR